MARPRCPPTQKQKPPVFSGGLKPRLLRFAGTDEGVRPYARDPSTAARPEPPLGMKLALRVSAFVQQYAFGLLRIHWTVIQLVRFQEDLDERRPGCDRALDQGLGERIFDVL